MPKRVIAELIEGLDIRPRGGARDCCATGISEDSRTIEQGMIFTARPGAVHDGRACIEQARERGAVAVLSDATGCHGLDAPALECTDPIGASAELAHRLAGHPSRRMGVVGVTGTNGKSSVTWLVRQILERCALMGGIETDDLRTSCASALTTPDAPSIAAWLGRALDHGAAHAVMEVSSHAIDQRRIEGVRFAVGVFTNLSGDHLDYHQSMEAYASVKRRLFESLERDATAIINIDDDSGAAMAGALSGRVVSCSLGASADVTGKILSSGGDGLVMRLESPWGSADIWSSLIGRHNAMNLLQAAAVAGVLGMDMGKAGDALSRATAPPGRLERVGSIEGRARVFVDFAHTDGALEAVLASLRPIVPEGGRLITVMGCGGDRDRTKRPRMGRVASLGSDALWITSDNPRTESPRSIIQDIEGGVGAGTCDVHIEVDRRRAIDRAIAMAAGGDVVLIAGKGHETVQIVGCERTPFDDRIEAKRALQRSATPGVDWVERGVFTDTRACVPGGLFVAITGPVHDGHDHLGAALGGGAAAAMVRHGTDVPDGLEPIFVEDPRVALGELARAWRRRLESMRVVAVTGTAGKTTTKNMLATICERHLDAVASPKSFNNDIGVPLTILTARPGDAVLIAEVGTSSPGEIAPLADMLAPDIAVVTLVGHGHLEGLKTLEAVAREKYALIESLCAHGQAFIRHQDFVVPACRGEVRTFGPEPEADHVLEAYGSDEDGAWMQFEDRRWRLGQPGEHIALDALVAVLCARAIGLDDDAIQDGLNRCTSASGRFRVHDVAGAMVIDDSWNANPDSMRASLESFGQVSGSASRRVIVLGDMLEMGTRADALHADLARDIAALHARVGLDRVVLVGAHMGVTAHALGTTMDVTHVGRVDEIHLDGLPEPGDCILVKASRGIGLDRLVSTWRSGMAHREQIC